MTIPENRSPIPASSPFEERQCADFQAGMAARIAVGEDFTSDAHLHDCPRCQALLADLEAIAAAARLLLPTEEEPGDALWNKIEQAITSEPS